MLRLDATKKSGLGFDFKFKKFSIKQAIFIKGAFIYGVRFWVGRVGQASSDFTK